MSALAIYKEFDVARRTVGSSSAKDSRQVVWTVAKGTFDRAMFPRYL